MAEAAKARTAGPRPGGGELALVEAIRRRSLARRRRGDAVTLGIGDDCAILQPPAGHEVLVTTDFSLEGRHFSRNLHPARSAGHRCLARGLSDLASMGAKPIAAFLSLALPVGLRRTARGRVWTDEFLEGLMTLAEAAGTTLAGGDTASTPGDLVIADIVLTGSAPRGTSLRRSGARPGDLLYVTGSLGGAAAELRLLEKRPRQLRAATPDGDHPQLFPQPRLRTAWRLRARVLATAAIDISDGLSTDLRHLCVASDVGALVDASALPIHPLAQGERDGGLGMALHGGEDYEVLFAARPATRIPARIAGVPVRRIGFLTQSTDVLLQHSSGTLESLTPGGWEHNV